MTDMEGSPRRETAAQRVGFRARTDAVADALERLFLAYTEGHHDGETVRMWSARVSDASIASVLEESSITTGGLA